VLDLEPGYRGVPPSLSGVKLIIMHIQDEQRTLQSNKFSFFMTAARTTTNSFNATNKMSIKISTLEVTDIIPTLNDNTITSQSSLKSFQFLHLFHYRNIYIKQIQKKSESVELYNSRQVRSFLFCQIDTRVEPTACNAWM
jgi:hypothetical protein